MPWWSSYTFQVVFAGATLLGVVGGIVGCFALLRRQSLLGDALAHAALPGVCLGFLIAGGKQPAALFLGALGAGLAGALFVNLVVRGSRVKEDSAIGIVLSVFFGVGIALLTMIQKRAAGNQSGLDKFLFGQAATLLRADVAVFAAVAVAVGAVVFAGYKEFKLLCFDRAFAQTIGLPVRALEAALTCLLVAVVVIGLQTVGVVLMVASLITPAAAARQWTDRFALMLALSGLIGGLASAVGVALSAPVADLPTGPVIVLVSSAFLVVSILFAPRRGLLWGLLESWRLARRIRREHLLKDLYTWGEREGAFADGVRLPILMGLRGQSGGDLRATASRLAAQGLVEPIGDRLRLSAAGLAEAERVVRKHRIWEVFLARRLELPTDHVHRDAEAMEHALSDEAVAEYEELLGFPSHDPHGRAIPPRRTVP